jgi:hypothetical protein
MADEDRHERVEAARIRAELTAAELWLRYVALGGNGDLFDIDGYLTGVLPLSAFDQDVLAVAVNERLEEVYRAARVPLATRIPDPDPADELRDVVAALLRPSGAGRPAPGDATHPPRDPATAGASEPDDVAE